MMITSTRIFGMALFFLAVGVLAAATGWPLSSMPLALLGGFALGVGITLLISDILGGWRDGRSEE